ncbi:MAG: 3-oxoacyl-ACP reductase FabG [Polyangiaceae bacterium]|nr:3-oxoacyl-ACP reductase FabG [Polyangiaceae bacterium]
MSESKVSALVTGGSRGIGRAVALELARSGRFVIINYLANDTAAEESLRAVRDAGGDGVLARFDVSDREATAAALDALLRDHGFVEVLVNNAGIARDGLFLMLKPEEWDSVIATTLHGFFNVTRPVLKQMVVRRRGSIVNVSSVSGQISNRGQSNYSAAKAGLIAATRALALEVGRLGIRVNAVAPGLVDTDMIKNVRLEMVLKSIPMQRVARPEEIARVVRFLCSDDASYMTGQVVAVNGGLA